MPRGRTGSKVIGREWRPTCILRSTQCKGVLWKCYCRILSPLHRGVTPCLCVRGRELKATRSESTWDHKASEWQSWLCNQLWSVPNSCWCTSAATFLGRGFPAKEGMGCPTAQRLVLTYVSSLISQQSLKGRDCYYPHLAGESNLNFAECHFWGMLIILRKVFFPRSTGFHGNMAPARPTMNLEFHGLASCLIPSLHSPWVPTHILTLQ